MNKISAVYKITNKITGERYVGSSKDVYKRWKEHKCPSSWKAQPNNRMYQDMQKYGIDQFEFEIIVPAAPTHLKICEQEFIDIYKSTYNSNRANIGLDKDEYNKQYRADHKEEIKEKACQKLHNMNLEEWKQLKYKKHKEVLERAKEVRRKNSLKYNNQICLYNGEELKLITLSNRFRKLGIPNPSSEAKKYLIS